MAGNNNNAAGTWICKCGKTNTGKFCVKCGEPRPAAPATQPVSPTEWVCDCGKTNTGKFCVKCGNPRPASDSGNASRSVKSAAVMPAGGNNPVVEGASAMAAAHKSAEEAAARKAAEEAAARKAAEEAAARKAVEEAAARKAVQAQKLSQTPSGEGEGNKGMLVKAAIGVAVLLLLIGAYFMLGKKKEEPPAPEPQKVETKAETKTETKTETKEEMKADTEKPMDPAVREAKLKEYAEAVKTANAQKKKDATATEKIVFLVEDVQRKGNDLIISGHFYNGKRNRTIISVKALELDIVLRDVDKELMSEKNIKYEKAFTGMNIKPLKDSEQLTVTLPGKVPAGEFNNFTVTAHDVHWEGVGD